MVGLYVFWLIVKKPISRFIKLKICAICATVTSTWLFLWILKFLGYEIPFLILGILMGESLTGLMYYLEKRAKKQKHILLLRPVVIFLGTLVIYLLIKFVFG
jgi:hypothetical protein